MDVLIFSVLSVLQSRPSYPSLCGLLMCPGWVTDVSEILIPSVVTSLGDTQGTWSFGASHLWLLATSSVYFSTYRYAHLSMCQIQTSLGGNGLTSKVSLLKTATIVLLTKETQEMRWYGRGMLEMSRNE